MNDCVGGEDERSVRLVGGVLPIEGRVEYCTIAGFKIIDGRVEYFSSAEWNTICDNKWDNNNAAVVCNQLGYDTEGNTQFINVLTH